MIAEFFLTRGVQILVNDRLINMTAPVPEQPLFIVLAQSPWCSQGKFRLKAGRGVDQREKSHVEMLQMGFRFTAIPPKGFHISRNHLQDLGPAPELVNSTHGRFKSYLENAMKRISWERRYYHLG
ncbi:hypothetical protein C5167_010489 [Papaver somniferum]|uniref:Uncharacterized protein n=1 Tax=Papaver somniferum TaxID=3469 RepID=A0A4Y7K482_PAPSO|nr:hypothetical protein C5167_010489 [Papaver somniferum]